MCSSCSRKFADPRGLFDVAYLAVLRSRVVCLTNRFRSQQLSFLSGRHHFAKPPNAVTNLGRSAVLRSGATASCYEMSASVIDDDMNLLLQESATIDEEMAPVFCYRPSRSIKYPDKPLAFVFIPMSPNDLAAKLDELLKIELSCCVAEIL